jgi:hypothetical protein
MAVSNAPAGVVNTYAPLDEVKSRGGISTTTNDASLWLALHGASRAIDRICNRHFFTLFASRAFDIGDGVQIVLPDLATVTAVREDTDGDRVFETTRTISDYLLYPSNADPTQPWGRPYDSIVADPRGAAPTFTFGRRRVQIEGEWTYRRHVEDTGADLNMGGLLGEGATTITVDDGTLISPGQTVLLESEQIYVRNLATNVLTVVRAVNGTSAVTHVDGIDVSVFRYPAEVSEAAILMASWLWKRKDTPMEELRGGAVSAAWRRYRESMRTWKRFSRRCGGCR